ncbi:transporter [Bdellovibrio sp. SKB1291214]|uniref:transporter n=1 Tax=Bdellovibrio sp. SKB1291214 TaxID=1732569 RepID=UPI0020CD4084|nr:transporter [Bdellovibrio sp. SKB1291214]UYL07367.1 transporter [Bdellovibrio sp. SKB1291214]
MNLKRLLATAVLLISATSQAKIKDNSFLMEEAYNQEAGVVQFINGFQYTGPADDWNYTFTNELPMGNETHQFSYVIPVAKFGATDETGLGDILLNYRYQLINNDHIAMAPRFSLITPTGDYKKGFGMGTPGFQFNHSVSIIVNEKWTNHWNAGFTYVPSAKNSNDDTANLFGYNFGTSVVYDINEKLNFLCEFVFNSMDTIDDAGMKLNGSTYYVVPGFRTSFQAGKETEIVPGIAAILGAGPSADEHVTGVFAYLSIESKLW